jgi:hypothetical protein
MCPYIIFPVMYNRKPYFFPYWTSNTGLFLIVHYVREVTRWFLSSASKLFLIVIYNQINLFDI